MTMSDENFYGRDRDGDTWYVLPNGSLIQAANLELAREREHVNNHLTPVQMVRQNQICIESYGIKVARS